MRSFLIAVIVALFSVGAIVQADTWTVTSGNSGGFPVSIDFSFDGSRLSLNTTRIVTTEDFWYGDYNVLRMESILYMNGSWAVFGTVSDHQLTPDPYATFVIDGTNTGHVEWAGNTPCGYEAPLLLGAVFQGDGGRFYRPMGIGSSVYGTLLLVERFSSGTSQDVFRTQRVSHTFTATYVPEPSGLVALLSGVGSIGIMFRLKGVHKNN